MKEQLTVDSSILSEAPDKLIENLTAAIQNQETKAVDEFVRLCVRKRSPLVWWLLTKHIFSHRFIHVFTKLELKFFVHTVSGDQRMECWMYGKKIDGRAVPAHYLERLDIERL